MTLDTGAIIGLISLVVSLAAAIFGAGVAVGQFKEKVERLDRRLDDEEHKSTNKNDRQIPRQD
jgi:hypothetical protein